MFCPKCAEEQSAVATPYCTGCGFKMENLKSFIEANGELNAQISARQKGIRRGAKMILISLALFPLYVFLAPLFPANDVLIESSPDTTWFEQIGWAIMTTLFTLGLIRIAYAFIFENDAASVREKTEPKRKSFKSDEKSNALPPQHETPVSNFGAWRETNDDLFQSVFVERKTSGDLK